MWRQGAWPPESCWVAERECPVGCKVNALFTAIITAVCNDLGRRIIGETWRSKLKTSRNKCYHEFLPSKLDFPPHSPLLNLTHFPDYFRNPDEIPSIQCDFSVFGVTLQWLRCSHRCFEWWVSFTSSWTWAIPFFSFYGKDGKDRTATSLVMISRPAVDVMVRK